MISNTKIEVTKSIIEQTGAQSKEMKSQIPIKEEVTPVMEIHKFSNITRYASTASTGTIYTTPTDKDFYLTSVTLYSMKDAASTTTASSVTFYVDGYQTRIISLPFFNGTAGDKGLSLNLSYPIKVDRNTAIQIIGENAGATTLQKAAITGFLL